MTVLTNHMTWRVSITVLCIVIGTLVEECLEDLRVAPDACNMERRSQVLRLAVQMGVELSKNLDHLHMTFIARHMQRCPAIRVAFVEEGLGQLGILFDQQLVAGLIVALLRVDPYISQKAPLLLLILLSLRLDALRPLLLFN